MKKILNLSYRSGIELEKKLSNLYPYTFEIDGIEIKSIEGFLQSLKTNDINEKRKIWDMYGVEAWRYGQKFNSWKDNQLLYWNGESIRRNSLLYTQLISKSYDRLFENKEFKSNLKRSMKYKLTHSIGQTDVSNTLLTKDEYIGNMERLRGKIKEKRFFNLFNI
jgi:protein GP30.3